MEPPKDACGLSCCHGNRMQRLARPVTYLVCICCLVFVQSLVVSGYSSAVLTTIESRYGLLSTQLGYIISSYDVTSMVAGIVVSYCGDRHNRALWLGRGAMFIALGSALFAVPMFVGDQYTYSSENTTRNHSLLCREGNVEIGECADDGTDSTRWALGVFMAAFMLIGVGASPVYTLGPTYLYDNCWRVKYPVYSSLMYSMGALGPAVGFLVGAGFLQLWVEPWDPPAGPVPGSAWVGAWWAGFLVCAGLAFLVSIPLHMFPTQLPGLQNQDASQDLREDDQERPTFAGYGKHIKDFPRILWRLLCTPTWLFISLAYVAEQVIGTGFNRYVVKYLQVSFGMAVYTASIMTGCVLIPAAVLGIVTGGVVMKKLALTKRAIMQYLLALNLLPTACLAAMMTLNCHTQDIAGININYSPATGSVYNRSASCNAQCACDMSVYDPVCGSDDVTYTSACAAGCQTYVLEEQRYHGCLCVTNDENVYDENEFAAGDVTMSYDFAAGSDLVTVNPGDVTLVNYDIIVDSNDAIRFAEPGHCQSDCQYLAALLVLLFIAVFTTSCGQNPVLLITLRSVDAGNRSFALGMQNFLIQILAFIPAPIVFGRIFDNLCLVWSSECGSEGACAEYDTSKLSVYFIGTCLGLKGFTFLFLFLAWLSAGRVVPKKNQYELGDVPKPYAGLAGVTSSGDPVNTVSFAYTTSPPETLSPQ